MDVTNIYFKTYIELFQLKLTTKDNILYWLKIDVTIATESPGPQSTLNRGHVITVK